MRFIRYGTLVPQYHDISARANGEDWFHLAPVEYGFYAFPKNYVEYYLLGGVGYGSVKNGRWKFLRDHSGNKLYMTYDNYYNDVFPDDVIKRCKELNIQLKDIRPYYEKNGVKISSVYDTDEISKDTKLPIVYPTKRSEFNYNGLIWHHLINYVKRPEILKQVGEWILTDIKSYEKAFTKWQNQARYTLRQRGVRYMIDDLEVFIESIQK